MKEKAIQNLEAGNLLLVRGLVDAAASRFYYALFQAAIHALEGKRASPSRPGARPWSHRVVGDRIAGVRNRDGDAAFFRKVRDLRGRADYDASPVERRDVEYLKHEIERFVREVTA